jgi:hypothetical protein
MMAAKRIVSNTGPLIPLEKLHQDHDFIRQLYDVIIIPKNVPDEVTEFHRRHAAMLAQRGWPADAEGRSGARLGGYRHLLRARQKNRRNGQT